MKIYKIEYSVCPICNAQYQHEEDAEICLERCSVIESKRFRLEEISEEIRNLRKERVQITRKHPQLKTTGGS